MPLQQILLAIRFLAVPILILVFSSSLNAEASIQSPLLQRAEAKTLLSQGKWAEAAIVLKELNTSWPRDISVAIDFAETLAHLGRREEGITGLQRVMGFAGEKDQPLLKRRVRVLSRMFFKNETADRYQEGLNFLWVRKFDEARSRLSAAQSLEPDNVEVLLRLSQASIMMGEFEPAIEWLVTAQRLNPYLAEISLWLGRARTKKGEYSEAIAELVFALGELRDSELAPLWLADVYDLSGDRERAYYILKRDLERNSAHVLSRLRLAELFLADRGSTRLVSAKELLAQAKEFLADYSEKNKDGSSQLREGELGLQPYDIEQIKLQAEKLDSLIESRSS